MGFFGGKQDVNGDVSGQHSVVAETAAVSRTLAARADEYLSVTDFGADPNATDNTTAFQAAFAACLVRTYGCHLRIPGSFKVASTLAATVSGNAGLHLIGSGSAVSQIVWTADTDGLTVTLASSSAWLQGTPGTTNASFSAHGIAFVRHYGTEGHTALAITGTASLNPGAKQVWLQDTVYRGDAAGGWQNGVVLTTVSGVNIDDFYFHAPQNAHGTGNGITLAGSAAYEATEFHLSRVNMQYPSTCYSIGDHVEGLTISDSSCVGASNGIVANSPSDIDDMLLVVNSHWDTLQSVITSVGFNSVDFANNYILANEPTSLDGYVAFNFTQGARIHLTGNHLFGRPGAANQVFVQVVNSGLTSQSQVSIVGNTAESLATFANLYATSNTQVVGNQCVACSTMVYDPSQANAVHANTLNGTSARDQGTTLFGSIGIAGQAVLSRRRQVGAVLGSELQQVPHRLQRHPDHEPGHGWEPSGARDGNR